MLVIRGKQGEWERADAVVGYQTCVGRLIEDGPLKEGLAEMN